MYKLNGIEDHIHSIKEKQRLFDYVLNQKEHPKVVNVIYIQDQNWDEAYPREHGRTMEG